jgi:hypothetical protein
MTHWVDEWVSLVADILTLAPAAKGKLLLDLVNEPDGYQLQWEVGDEGSVVFSCCDLLAGPELINLGSDMEDSGNARWHSGLQASACCILGIPLILQTFGVIVTGMDLTGGMPYAGYTTDICIIRLLLCSYGQNL